jgi:hypothetical protein
LNLSLRSRATAPVYGRSVRMKTTRERAEERRQAKLELVEEQVQNGSLVIRQMTDEERRQNPPRPPRPPRGNRRP